MTSGSNRNLALATLALLLAGALWLISRMLAPYLAAIFIAWVLGVCGYPLYSLLERRWRRPALASLVATALIVAAIAGPVTLLLITVGGEARTLYRVQQASSQLQGGWHEWFVRLTAGPLGWVARVTGADVQNVEAALLSRLHTVGEIAVGTVGDLFVNVGSTLLNALIAFFTLFFFFQRGAALRQLTVHWTPLTARRVEELLDVVADTIRANVYGTLVIAAVQGAATGIGFAIVGLASPWLWGVVAAFCSLVPVVGPALVWVPGAIALAFGGAWVRVAILALWSILVVAGVCDNIVRPLVLRGRMPMNTLLIFFSILGGVQYFGILGIIAGPVVFSVTAALLRILGEMLREQPPPPAPTTDPACPGPASPHPAS